MFSHPQIPFVLRVQQVSDSLTINLHVTHLKTGIGKDRLMVVKASSLWKLCSAGRNSHRPLQESCEWVSQFNSARQREKGGRVTRYKCSKGQHELQTLHPCVDPLSRFKKKKRWCLTKTASFPAHGYSFIPHHTHLYRVRHLFVAVVIDFLKQFFT